MIGIGQEDPNVEFFEGLLRQAFDGRGGGCLHGETGGACAPRGGGGVAAVPTGMKTGVSITPCGVVRRPRRAPLGSVFRTSKRKLIPNSVAARAGIPEQQLQIAAQPTTISRKAM